MSNKRSKRWRWYQYLGATVLAVVTLAITVLATLWVWAGGEKVSPEQQVWGTTYSNVVTRELKLDPHETYLAIVNELKPKRLRLVAYWNEIEPTSGTYDFAELDFQIAAAEKAGIPYILAVGRRVPRYPECFAPDWAKKLPESEQQSHILTYIAKVVERYDARPHLITWQVENEPFLHVFGQCPDLDPAFLSREIALVRSKSQHPIMTTDSGELSLGLAASQQSDIFGTTLYRTVLDKNDKAVTWFYSPEYYARRANLIKKVNPNIREVVLAELQAEPWGNAPLVTYNQEYFDKTMSHQKFDEVMQFARDTGLAQIYTWGPEWWYYQKLHGDSYYWEQGKKIFAGSAR